MMGVARKKMAMGGLLAMFAIVADAAVITWSSSAFENIGFLQRETGTNQFNTAGIQIYAENCGGGALTFDGINFAAGAVDFGGTYSDYHTADASEISDVGTYKSDGGAMAVTLGAGGVGTIVSGETYRVQLLLMDGRAQFNGRFAEVDHVCQGYYAGGVVGETYGDGLLVTGIFIADSDSQDFTIEVFAGKTSRGGHLNALLLHEIPPQVQETYTPDPAKNVITNMPSYLAGYEDLYSEDPHAAALAWFKEAKFGLFVHYGLYSIYGKGTWALRFSGVSTEEYENLKDQFTAENFDADFITDLAIEAGMKYVNITAKHHDGFCLFDSAYTDYDSADSPATRDLIAELAEQCEEKGLGLFLYYSYALDWKHPYFYPNQYCYVSRSDLNNPPTGYKFRTDEDFRHYIDFANNQLRELLTKYGALAGIWFDPMTAYYAKPDLFPIEETYAMMRELQPQTLISFKQGATGYEDFAAPERHGKIKYDWVVKKFPNRPRSIAVAKNACEKNTGKHNEICDTLQRRKWGYYPPSDGKHLTPEEVMDRLAHAASIDCNLLLNTGPLPDGSIHPADVETLRAVGKMTVTVDKDSASRDFSVKDSKMAQ